MISRYEIKILWVASIFWITSFIIYPLQLIASQWEYSAIANFLVRGAVGVLIAFGVFYLLHHLYPNALNKKLRRLRYIPRISPKTGRPMKLLTEEEEDVYLDEGMQAEEDVFSVDYDVWIDEDTGYTQIEKYSGKYLIKQCSKCSYQTLKIEKEELLIAPTATSTGELLKRYRCTYCGHTEKEIFNVAKLKEDRNHS